jgi:hypothetical protein
MSEKIGASVEIVSILVRVGPGHQSWRSRDPFDFVAFGQCDLGKVKLKAALGQKKISFAYGHALGRELKKLGLQLENRGRKKPGKGSKPRSK